MKMNLSQQVEAEERLISLLCLILFRHPDPETAIESALRSVLEARKPTLTLVSDGTLH